jgi:hypothetical protein
MKNIHLTDDEIQQYALDAESCNKGLIEHIQQCEHCLQQAMQYQLLFEGIGVQEKSVFDFDLADLVMEQLPQATPSYDRPLLYALGGVIAVMIGVVGYVFGNGLVSLFAYVQPILIGLILTTMVGLMVFLGVDMYQKYKAQMKALNFY